MISKLNSELRSQNLKLRMFIQIYIKHTRLEQTIITITVKMCYTYYTRRPQIAVISLLQVK